MEETYFGNTQILNRRNFMPYNHQNPTKKPRSIQLFRVVSILFRAAVVLSRTSEVQLAVLERVDVGQRVLDELDSQSHSGWLILLLWVSCKINKTRERKKEIGEYYRVIGM